MAGTIIIGKQHMSSFTYEGNGGGQRVGNFVPFTNDGTIAKSVMVDYSSSSYLQRTQDTVAGDDNKRKATFSFWFKPSGARLGNETCLFGAAPSGRLFARFDTSDRLMLRLTNGTTEYQKVTNRTFQTTDKFYHFLWQVDASQSTATDRSQLYIDGDRITSWNSDNNPAQNTDIVGLADGTVMRISSLSHSAAQFFDGYIAEFNCVSGSVVAPSVFGVTDTSTGRWVPKALTGITYGTNGFRCTFANTAGLTIGDDTSGNGNDFDTLNGIGTDHIRTDSPTQNFITADPFTAIGTAPTLKEGGLQLVYASGSGYPKIGFNKTIPQSGKWYWEVKATAVGGYQGIANPDCGLADLNLIQVQAIPTNANMAGSAGVLACRMESGFKFTDVRSTSQSLSTIGSTNMADGDYWLWALDMDNGKLFIGHYDASGTSTTYFAADGGTDGNPANGTNPTFEFDPKDHRFVPVQEVFAPGSYASTWDYNFGSKAYDFTAPSGYGKLSQENFPESDEGIGGMVWVKNRDTTDYHTIYDSSRGISKEIYPNDTSAEASAVADGLKKFLKGGFATEDAVNLNEAGESFVAWNWVANGGTTAANTDGSGASIASTTQANQTAGFSIVQYTGTGSAGTVAHGLSAAPTMIAVKNLGDSASWYVYMNVTRAASPNTYYMRFDSDDSQSQTGAVWNDTTPTSSVFTVGGEDTSNKNTKNYVAYCWTDIPGYSRVGTFNGNANADGSFVYTGFRPQWLMIKGLDVGNGWTVWDSARSVRNPLDTALFWNTTGADDTGNTIDFLSNGFKPRSTNADFNGSNIYGYLAFAEHPFNGDGTNPCTAR